MIDALKSFSRDEDGAVTVDWVVMTAAIVGLGVAVISTVADGATTHADSVSNHLASQNVKLGYTN